MAKVMAGFSMSLDGFVADENDGVDDLFGWYFEGDHELETPLEGLDFRLFEPSYSYVKDLFANTGAIVSGRRLFDITDGWGGRHPIDAPVVVVTHNRPEEWIATHPDAPFTFVDDVATAVEKAKELAGDQLVGVAGPNVVQQCINLGLVDEIAVDLVPVLIGKGISFFGDLVKPPVKFEDPEIVQAKGVTHMRFAVKRD